MVLEKIRDGSVGTIYKALDQAQRTIAIKQIREDIARRRDRLKAFRKEAEHAKNLDHRYIIKTYEYIDYRPLPFFTMEYFPSENIRFAMWHRRDWIYGKEFTILRKLAEALSYLHAQQLVHRDIKPENVLISSSSEVRLIDLSLAYRTRWWTKLLPRSRHMSGTISYMSPEQITGRSPDPRSDVYSFGVLTYELLTKRHPFVASGEQDLLTKHVKVPPPRMRDYIQGISEEVESFVYKMLEKKKEERFQDMAPVYYHLAKFEQRDEGFKLRQVAPFR
jgi:serine/threonine protein kinase